MKEGLTSSFQAATLIRTRTMSLIARFLRLVVWIRE